MTGTVHVRPSDPAALPEVRCACGVCGAHVRAWRLHALTGHCSNCGSYELRPLQDAVAARR
jgi:hypothetical protein